MNQITAPAESWKFYQKLSSEGLSIVSWEKWTTLLGILNAKEKNMFMMCISFKLFLNQWCLNRKGLVGHKASNSPFLKARGCSQTTHHLIKYQLSIGIGYDHSAWTSLDVVR